MDLPDFSGLRHRLQWARLRAGYSAGGLATAAYVDSGHVRDIERGERYTTALRAIGPLAKFLRIDADWLRRGLGRVPEGYAPPLPSPRPRVQKADDNGAEQLRRLADEHAKKETRAAKWKPFIENRAATREQLKKQGLTPSGPSRIPIKPGKKQRAANLTFAARMVREQQRHDEQIARTTAREKERTERAKSVAVRLVPLRVPLTKEMAARCKATRLSAGLSAPTMTRLAGVPSTTVYYLEGCAKKSINTRNLEAVATSLSVHVDWLITGAEIHRPAWYDADKCELDKPSLVVKSVKKPVPRLVQIKKDRSHTPAQITPAPGLPHRLKSARWAAGLTLRALSSMAGVANGAICNIETGRNKPRHATYKRLADSLSISVAWLIGADESNRPAGYDEKATFGTRWIGISAPITAPVLIVRRPSRPPPRPVHVIEPMVPRDPYAIDGITAQRVNDCAEHALAGITPEQLANMVDPADTYPFDRCSEADWQNANRNFGHLDIDFWGRGQRAKKRIDS